MRFVVVVACGIPSVFNKVLLAIHHFGDSARKKAFALLSDYVFNQTFLALEIVAHALRSVFAAFVLKHRVALQLSSAVGHAHRVHFILVHIHVYLVCLEVDIAIGHIARPIHECIVVSGNHKRIFCSEINHIIKVNHIKNKPRFFHLIQGVGNDAVGRDALNGFSSSHAIAEHTLWQHGIFANQVVQINHTILLRNGLSRQIS